jgi:hypothetical protein
MQAQARKLSPRIVEGIQATKSAISSGTTSGWGSSLALQELSGAIIGGTERFGGFDAMVATGATQPRPVNTKFGFVVATAVGDEVAEANFKPATALSFATETLPERKLACITAFTSEVARHANPAAFEAVNRELLGGLAAAADRLFFCYVVDTVGAADIGGSGTAAVGIADDFRNALSAMDGSSRSRFFRLFVNSATAIEWATPAAVSPVFERMTPLGRNDVWSDGLCQG